MHLRMILVMMLQRSDSARVAIDGRRLTFRSTASSTPEGRDAEDCSILKRRLARSSPDVRQLAGLGGSHCLFMK